MEFFRPYGVACKVRVPMIKAGSDDFAATADWTPAAGDVKVSKDGGALSNVGTLPAVISSSAMWEFTFSASEMEADEITVTVIDSATKAVKDQAFSIRTTIPGAIRVRRAQGAADSTHITLDASASATDDLYNGAGIAILAGTAAGQSRVISDYVGSTKVATVDSAWATNPDSTSIFAILPLGVVGLNATQLRSAVGLATNNLDTQLSALATAAALSTVAGYVDTEVGAIKSVVDAIEADTQDIQSRLPTALVGGRISASMGAIAGSTDAADKLARSGSSMVLGTVGSGSTTTSVVASSLTPASAVNDQLNGRVIIFASNTTTTALRGQASSITDFDHATQALTVAALTTAPSSGDTFVIV